MVKAAYIDKNGLKRGAWSEEEDNKLRTYVLRYKAWNWRQLPKFAGLRRCGKSCRLRWKNYLDPDLKRGDFTKEDEELILRLHQKHGNKWSLIAKSMPGRTDNEIKNYWHTKLSKRTKPTDVSTQSLDQLEALDQNKEASAAIAVSDLSTQNREEDTTFFDCLIPISSPSIVSTLSGIDSVPRNFGNFGNEPVSYCYSNSPEESSPINFQSIETNDILVDSSREEVLPTTGEDFMPTSGIERTREDYFGFGISPLIDNQNPMGTYPESFGNLSNELPLLDSSKTEFPEDTFLETFENLSLDASDTEILPSSFTNSKLVTDEFKSPEQNFCDTFKNFPVEPFSMDTSNTDILPFSAYNPTLVADKFKNPEETFFETFESFPAESFSIDASNSLMYSPENKNIFPLAAEVFPSFDTLKLQSHRDTMESLFDPFSIFGKAKKLASTSCTSAVGTQAYGTPDKNSCSTSGSIFTEPFSLDASNSNIWPSTMLDASTLLGYLDTLESFGTSCSDIFFLD